MTGHEGEVIMVTNLFVTLGRRGVRRGVLKATFSFLGRKLKARTSMTAFSEMLPNSCLRHKKRAESQCNHETTVTRGGMLRTGEIRNKRERQVGPPAMPAD